MKKIKINIGKWYGDNVGNHLYMPLSVKYTNNGSLKCIKCAFYCDLKYSCLFALKPSSFRLLKPILSRAKVSFLQPVSNQEQFEMRDTFNSLPRKKNKWR
jgi:hypothetical protein